MKALVTILFCLFLNSASWSGTPNCLSLHKGNFEVQSDDGSVTTVQRIKNLQIEENTEHGFKAVFEITWVNECTYELRPKELIKGDPELFGSKENVMTVHIKELKSDSYTAEVTSNFFDETMTFEVDIVEK